MEIERVFMNCFSIEKNPADIFASIKIEKRKFKKTVQVALLKKPNNCNNAIAGATESATELKKRLETDLVKQLERSNFTEKQGHAVCSQNSNKRKRSTSHSCNYATPSCSKVHDKSKEFHEYKNLIENWRPPSLQIDNLDLDEDINYGYSKENLSKCEWRKKMTICGSCSALWPPRAQYLPDADLYALPYTLPF